jgi:hypothetical protein
LAGGCAICFARLPDPDKPQIEQRPCRCSINGNCLMAAEQVDKVKMLTDRISPILHGHNPEIQGAVLAELLATWLSGHVVPGDRMQTILLRGRLFHEHMKIVRDLTKLNAMHCHPSGARLWHPGPGRLQSAAASEPSYIEQEMASRACLLS